MKPIRLMKSFVTVGGWTLGSRTVGFARDMLMAAYLGTGPVAEAFLIAFSLPNMFRRFFAEGAFNMAFVPMFQRNFRPKKVPKDLPVTPSVGWRGFWLFSRFWAVF